MALCIAAAAGCPNVQPYTGAFEVPIAADVLQPEVGGPFSEPIGFVANRHGGQIVQLALKQGRFLTDDPAVSFLRTNQLATGDDRVLTSVAVHAPSLDEVTVFAGDAAFERLLRIPYLLDCSGMSPGDNAACDRDDFGPVEARAYVDIDAIVKPDTVEVGALGVKKGWTTTETWTLTYDGEQWIADGTRSGLQTVPIQWGQPWSAMDRRLQLTVSGSANTGDTITVKTRSGLSEIDVGGVPLSLQMSNDHQIMAMVVENRQANTTHLWWFDPATATPLSEVSLPTGAAPHRMDWTEDGRLVVADRARPAVYEVPRGATTATEISMPTPTLDVASLGQRVYAVSLDGMTMWMASREDGSLIDINAAVEGTQGMTFTSPLQGMSAMSQSYRMPEFTEDGLRRRGRSIALAGASGAVVFAHEDTGCLVQDNLGPRTVSSGVGNSQDFTLSVTGIAPPVLEQNQSSNRSVLVNPCAGIARSERWQLEYDQVLGGWRVEGSVSGEQQRIAMEDERYLSDDGAISFVILGGGLPSVDGWRISFEVTSGVATARGDLDFDGGLDVPIAVPGDPVDFFYRAGLPGAVGSVAQDDGWYAVDVRPFVLIPGGSSDWVGRVEPQRPLVEVGWQ